MLRGGRWFVGRLCQCRSTHSSDSIAEERFSSVVSDIFSTAQTPSTSHDVMVVHPKIRWGSSSASILKNSQLQLEEAETLVNTLPGFRVVDSAIFGVDYSTKRKSVWGSGQIEALRRRKQEHRVSAMMVNVNMLTPQQQSELYNIFRVPIFDRYNIVLSIFKHFAATEEARLQIQLAEIPYIRHRLHYLNRSPSKAPILHVEDVEKRGSADQFELIRLREQTIRKKLRALSEEGKKEAVRGTEDAALVAVVGYTNAGKTSLVKRLTGARDLHPKDRLFATLDTTRHAARLPSGRRVVFADTIGFLSDLPTSLLAAFEATLAHVRVADVILHLRDVSNPSWEAQSEDVQNTLVALGMTDEQLAQVVTVDNKIDKADEATSSTENTFRISCETGDGIDSLIAAVDQRVLAVTGCKMRRLRLKPSSPLIPYLYREGFVVRDPESTSSHLIFDVAMTDAEMTRMQKQTGGGGLKKRETPAAV